MNQELLPINHQYRCLNDLNLYDAPDCERLATQASQGRYVELLSENAQAQAREVRLPEDNYVAWLPLAQLSQLEPSLTPYHAVARSRSFIIEAIPDVIAFARSRMDIPNYYLWGGTVAPNYDCSGLIQAAFASFGIWLPRDSYQQADFTLRISQDHLEPGDLIFFASKPRVDHVALYLGDGDYIHSSGKDMGNNGIGINSLTSLENRVSRNYYQHLWGFGRVMSSLL